MTDQQTPETDTFYAAYLPPENMQGLGQNTSCDHDIAFARSLELRLREAEAAREDWKRYSDNWERSSREKEAALVEYQAKHTAIMKEADRRYDEQAARIAELEKDAARLDWLEIHHTLHTGVDILYIVDGYQVTLMHEDGITALSPAFEGHDLRAAIDTAILWKSKLPGM